MTSPNILVVLTDDHGQWAVNCYGTQELRTPNMDFLARIGARMAHAFTPTPVCSPARASFFSGRTASQHGIHDWLAEYETAIAERDWMADEQTLYQLLHAADYHVGHFGKWHCGRSHYPQPGVDRWFGLKYNQGTHGGRYTYGDEELSVELQGFKGRIITDRAVEWIRGPHGGRPWLTFVGMTSTHRPHDGLPERLVQEYRAVANRVIGTIDPPPDAHRVYEKSSVPEFQAQYFAAVSQLDEQLGRLIDAVEERGELDDTVIVYTADHGLHAGQLGYWEKGNGTRPLNMYERSIRIPMLLRHPARIPAGQTCEAFVDLCDLFHTLLDYAGAPLSAEQRAQGHHVGASFAPLLSGQARPWKAEQICEYGPVRMVRGRRFKLVRRHGHGDDQLFDLASDPDERTNVIHDSAHAELIEQYDGKLQAFFAQREEPGKSGHDVPREDGAFTFNPNEPWLPHFDNWHCAGWPAEKEQK